MKKKTTTTFTAVLALVLAVPAYAQEKPDTTTYRSAPVPVWVTVKQVSKTQVLVGVAVMWDHSKSSLRFSTDVRSGELVVVLPTAKRGDGCTYTASLSYGTDGYEKIDPDDDDCVLPPVSDMSEVGVTHQGSAMKCVEAHPETGKPETPGHRIWGCYWVVQPSGGG